VRILKRPLLIEGAFVRMIPFGQVTPKFSLSLCGCPILRWVCEGWDGVDLLGCASANGGSLVSIGMIRAGAPHIVETTKVNQKRVSGQPSR